MIDTPYTWDIKQFNMVILNEYTGDRIYTATSSQLCIIPEDLPPHTIVLFGADTHVSVEFVRSHIEFDDFGNWYWGMYIGRLRDKDGKTVYVYTVKIYNE